MTALRRPRGQRTGPGKGVWTCLSRNTSGASSRGRPRSHRWVCARAAMRTRRLRPAGHRPVQCVPVHLRGAGGPCPRRRCQRERRRRRASRPALQTRRVAASTGAGTNRTRAWLSVTLCRRPMRGGSTPSRSPGFAKEPFGQPWIIRGVCLPAVFMICKVKLCRVKALTNLGGKK